MRYGFLIVGLLAGTACGTDPISIDDLGIAMTLRFEEVSGARFVAGTITNDGDGIVLLRESPASCHAHWERREGTQWVDAFTHSISCTSYERQLPTGQTENFGMGRPLSVGEHRVRMTIQWFEAPGEPIRTVIIRSPTLVVHESDL